MKEIPSGFPEKYKHKGEEFYISPMPYAMEGKTEPYRMITSVIAEEGKRTYAMRPESEIGG